MQWIMWTKVVLLLVNTQCSRYLVVPHVSYSLYHTESMRHGGRRGNTQIPYLLDPGFHLQHELKKRLIVAYQ